MVTLVDLLNLPLSTEVPFTLSPEVCRKSLVKKMSCFLSQVILFNHNSGVIFNYISGESPCLPLLIITLKPPKTWSPQRQYNLDMESSW